ncbi:hypothetical protein L1987_72783 [Smallanthus sonchifolius]|uniref:Uncharacterized protein n=1 Tax=Smallanthus sonchifolius TaxID=185202 RepID=A0ACB9AWW2_9ASTR|nr:hypothetical protein L1987_72783 [Smallanthus sonchifolius]
MYDMARSESPSKEENGINNSRSNSERHSDQSYSLSTDVSESESSSSVSGRRYNHGAASSSLTLAQSSPLHSLAIINLESTLLVIVDFYSFA